MIEACNVLLVELEGLGLREGYVDFQCVVNDSHPVEKKKQGRET